MQNFLKTMTTFLLTAFSFSPAWAKASEGTAGFWHYGWDWSWGWPHMVFGGLMMIAFWGGIIFFVVLAVRWFGKDAADRMPPTGRSAMDILKERFARGEISKREYDDRKRHLSI